MSRVGMTTGHIGLDFGEIQIQIQIFLKLKPDPNPDKKTKIKTRTRSNGSELGGKIQTRKFSFQKNIYLNNIYKL